MNTIFLYGVLGRKIATVRKERGFTQEELALRAGIKRPTLACIETNKEHPPLHRVYALANALNIPIGELLPIMAQQCPCFYGYCDKEAEWEVNNVVLSCNDHLGQVAGDEQSFQAVRLTEEQKVCWATSEVFPYYTMSVREGRDDNVDTV